MAMLGKMTTRVLALETSGMAGSVAALDDDRVVVERELDPARRTAQTLVPLIRDVLQQVGWQPATVNLVAVTSGPGSFTGLRIGVTTAKTFAYATGAGVIGVNTLAVIARGVLAGQSSRSPTLSTGPLWVVVNAERDQLFVALFGYHEGGWQEIEPTRILDVGTWLSGLTAGSMVAGPGLKGIVDRIPAGVQVVPESVWMPRAAEVGREGLLGFQAGKGAQWWSLVPSYFRESAAVEKVAGPAPGANGPVSTNP